MSTIEECMLRKAAMLVAINQNYSTEETFNKVKEEITDDVIPDLSGLEEYGAVCWKKAYRMFLAQPPSCLTKDIVCRKKNKVV
uniref:Uncharacterized protein n=1 Tax=Panagrolaimus sp. PS1159 TaxID=55785 RepID=A0AC35FF21_9BILA